jgi:hypothetical protein
MPRKNLPVGFRPVSFLAEEDAYLRLKEICKRREVNVGEELNGLVRRRAMELEGRAPTPEDLLNLVADVSAWLEERSKEEVLELIRRRMGEWEREAGGRPSPRDEADYERLKERHNKLVKQVDQLEKRLLKRKVYRRLLDTAVEVGVDLKELSNLDEAAPRLLAKYPGPSEDAHQFITLMETVREKRLVERELSEIRSRSSASLPVVGEDQGQGDGQEHIEDDEADDGEGDEGD